MIAHQWRQPLTAISSAIVQIQLDQISTDMDSLDSEQLKNIIKIQNRKFSYIDEQIKLLSSIINDFRNFFKPTKTKEKISINSIIQKALLMMDVEFQEDDIKIITKIESNDTIYIHVNEVLQVVLNILKNSKDSFNNNTINNKNKQIIIKIFNKEDKIILSFTDNAGGINKEILPKIFDPYFSTKDEKNGTGLGLYMAKMIIQEYNNGTINVKNTTDGVTFEIIWDKM